MARPAEALSRFAGLSRDQQAVVLIGSVSLVLAGIAAWTVYRGHGPPRDPAAAAVKAAAARQRRQRRDGAAGPGAPSPPPPSRGARRQPRPPRAPATDPQADALNLLLNLLLQTPSRLLTKDESAAVAKPAAASADKRAGAAPPAAAAAAAAVTALAGTAREAAQENLAEAYEATRNAVRHLADRFDPRAHPQPPLAEALAGAVAAPAPAPAAGRASEADAKGAAAAAGATDASAAVSTLYPLRLMSLPPFHELTQTFTEQVARHPSRPGIVQLWEAPKGSGLTTFAKHRVQQESLSRPGSFYLNLAESLNVASDATAAGAAGMGAGAAGGGGRFSVGTLHRSLANTSAMLGGFDSDHSFTHLDAAGDASPLSTGRTGSASSEHEGLPPASELSLMEIKPWWELLLAAMGVHKRHFAALGIADPASALSLLTRALQLIRQHQDAAPHDESAPPYLLLDGMDVLMDAVTPGIRPRLADDAHPWVWDFLQWLLDAMERELIEITFCCNDKRMIGVLRDLSKLDRALVVVHLATPSDAAVAEYIVHDVNPRLPAHVEPFTLASAAYFAACFDGNVGTLLAYVSTPAPITVDAFVQQQRAQRLAELERHLPARLAVHEESDRESELKDIILELILRKGLLDADSLDVEKLTLTEVLVERNLLRPLDAKSFERQQKLLEISREQRRAFISTGASPPPPSAEPPSQSQLGLRGRRLATRSASTTSQSTGTAPAPGGADSDALARSPEWQATRNASSHSLSHPSPGSDGLAASGAPPSGLPMGGVHADITTSEWWNNMTPSLEKNHWVSSTSTLAGLSAPSGGGSTAPRGAQPRPSSQRSGSQAFLGAAASPPLPHGAAAARSAHEPDPRRATLLLPRSMSPSAVSESCASSDRDDPLTDCHNTGDVAAYLEAAGLIYTWHDLTAMEVAQLFFNRA